MDVEHLRFLRFASESLRYIVCRCEQLMPEHVDDIAMPARRAFEAARKALDPEDMRKAEADYRARKTRTAAGPEEAA